MAYDDRYDDDQTRDRERSRYGRDTGGFSDDYGRSRGAGMLGGRHDGDRHREHGGETTRRAEQGRDADWRREQGRDKGWGGGNRDRNRYEGKFEDGRSTRGHDPAGDRSTGQERRFGADDDHEGLPTDETSRLIGSNKVEGTAVYGRDGHRLGSIYNFMVDKRSGKVEYAVMSYGGFLGMGTRYYPLPWDILGYDTRLGGYRVEMVDRDLERAPSFDRSSEPSFDQSYGNRVRSWYGLGY